MEFPTQAERAVADWEVERHEKTVAFEVVAQRAGGTKFIDHDTGQKVIRWCFPDDSRVAITGMGQSHRIIAELP